MNNSIKSTYQMSRVKNRKVEINFAGGEITGDGGCLLLSKSDKKLKLIEQLAELFPDRRNPDLIIHKVVSMLRQRIYGIALGYEDLNDHDKLRNCTAMQTAVDVDKEIASSSTLCRLESNSNKEFIFEAHKIMVDKFIESYSTPPKEIILDFDATDDEVHGNQEGKAYHGYYRHNCFLPLYVFCGSQLLVSYLRTSDKDQAKHSGAILSILVKYIRSFWPEVEIIFRGDSGFCKHRMFDWCEKNNVKYIVGIGQNNRLNEMSKDVMNAAERKYEEAKIKQKLFSTFNYAADKWGTERKIVAKSEITEIFGKNRRYIVTNLAGDAEYLYNMLYCKRGDAENCIKQQQLELFADRTSAHLWRANQLRLILSSFAYILMDHVRRTYLKTTKLANAQVGTIRLKLLKIGAIIMRNSRRVRFLLSSSYPYQHIWEHIMKQFALE